MDCSVSRRPIIAFAALWNAIDYSYGEEAARSDFNISSYCPQFKRPSKPVHRIAANMTDVSFVSGLLAILG